MTLSFAPERIETWPLERLKPYARNAKTHGADQVAKIAASMAKFGWTNPVLVGGDGEVIAGHGRILAAAELGLTEAPVIVLDHLSEEERQAYRLADNRLAESPWDEALLAAELQALAADDFDLSLTGFSDAELDQLLAFDVGGARPRMGRASRRSWCRSLRATRRRGRAISGSSGTTVCSAATARRPTTCAG